jgi:hypothetical protein
MSTPQPDCRNACTEPLRYPIRPWNRPGLPRISYRIGAYGEMREALLRNLNKTQVLSGWTHQAPDDPGIALLEGASILGDILTLYQDVYANEAYLPTATWRESIADLVRLLGYRLAPGLGGAGDFAFEVSGDEPVTIPKGFPLTAQVTGLDGTADFETAVPLVAYPWLSRFRLFRPLSTPNISQATAELRIFSPENVELVPGDKLLVGLRHPSSNPNRLVGAEVVIVDSVREQHGTKLYRIRGRLTRPGSVFELAGFKLGRSFRHFAHTAPGTKVVVTSGTASQQSVSHMRLLTATTTTDVDPSIGPLEVPLEGKVDDLALGTPLICRSVMRRDVSGVIHYSPVQLAPFRGIAAVRQGAYTWGAITGPATVVVLDQNLQTVTDPSVDTWNPNVLTYDRIDIREAEFFETRSPLLALRAAPAEQSASTGHNLYFFGTDSEVQALQNRSLLLTPLGEAPEAATVQSVQTLATSVADRPLLRRVTLDALADYADYSNDDPTTLVYGNLARATQGKSERATPLGNGDSRQTFQTFKLPKAPLTYLSDPAESPPEVPELEIYVSDRLWKRVPTLFGHGPKEEIYIVREDAENTSWAQFGDGITGSVLPSGIANVVAVGRSGQGAYGPLKPDTRVQPSGRAARLDRVELPGEISGGTQPEDGENARRAAPGKVQSLGRVVAIRDFETEALAIAGVTLAGAAWALVDNVAAVVLTVLMDTGRDAEIAQVRQAMATANRCRGPQRFPVVVIAGTRRYVYVAATVAIDATYKPALVEAAIQEALGVAGATAVDGTHGLFTATRRDFGEREYSTRIEGAIQRVGGVLWAEVTELGSLGPASGPATLAYPTAPSLAPVVACESNEVLALHAAHLQLMVTVPAAAECC